MNTRAGAIALMLGIAALWICGSARAADVRAWLDRNAMQLGETVTLNVELAGGANAAQPDFSVLQQDFNLLGTQSSSSVNIVNGQTTAKIIWAVGLEPKHAGALSIPALNVAGSMTQPLSLTVTATSSGAGAKGNGDIFVELSATPNSPYVQQQVQLTVKLYYALNLADGKLFDPQAEGLVVRKLGQDSNYAAEANGRRYRVLERHYAASADKSGALTIAPLEFRGRAVDPNDFNSFFSRGREVATHSEAISLDVRARPATSGSDAWIPAQSLTLAADGIDTTAEAHVGEPITLTLKLKAQGLGFEQLPELKLPKVDGADIYPDKETTQNRDDGSWLHGERERKFAIVPNRAGALTIPALSLAWWDTEHDSAAIAEIPAVVLQVLPAAGGVANAVNASPAPTEPAIKPLAAAPVAVLASDSADTGKWRTLAMMAFVLWALTLAAWIATVLIKRRRGVGKSEGTATAASLESDKALRKNFLDACAREDLAATARALLAWAKLRRPSLRNLGELARALGDSAKAQLVFDLERALYSVGDDSSTLSERLSREFRRAPDFADELSKTRSESPLPPLYPFRV